LKTKEADAKKKIPGGNADGYKNKGDKKKATQKLLKAKD
jgi:hypothetical protein